MPVKVAVEEQSKVNSMSKTMYDSLKGGKFKICALDYVTSKVGSTYYMGMFTTLISAGSKKQYINFYVKDTLNFTPNELNVATINKFMGQKLGLIP